MSVLNRPAIQKYLDRGELIRNPRKGTNGRKYDLEPDSYDLSAGTAIWKRQRPDGYGGNVNILYYSESSTEKQPTVTVQPGQMIFVVTREDLKMPKNVCGTVYSRNSLALAGILALNAGHVDPEYQGPIAIRLINLRSIPWTLTLGDRIFTVTFHTVDSRTYDPIVEPQCYSQNSMISRVLETANSALSNALYDLYQVDVEKRLSDFKAEALKDFTQERDERWVKRDELWRVLLGDVWAKIIAGLIFVAVVAAPIVAVVVYLLSRNPS